MEPYALGPGEGRILDYGIPHVVKAGELSPGRGAAFLEMVTRQGEEPEDHTHGTEDEVFYVLEGELTFRCDGDVFEATKGSFVYLPCGRRHGYAIKSPGEVRLLIATFPVRKGEGGWGGYVADVEANGAPIANR